MLPDLPYNQGNHKSKKPIKDFLMNKIILLSCFVCSYMSASVIDSL